MRLFLLLLLASIAAAEVETFHLKDGRVLDGIYQDGKIVMAMGAIPVALDQIATRERKPAPPALPAPAKPTGKPDKAPAETLDQTADQLVKAWDDYQRQPTDAAKAAAKVKLLEVDKRWRDGFKASMDLSPVPYTEKTRIVHFVTNGGNGSEQNIDLLQYNSHLDKDMKNYPGFADWTLPTGEIDVYGAVRNNSTAKAIAPLLYKIDRVK